jgi:hypothetical protein
VRSDYLSDYLNFGMLHRTAGSVSFLVHFVAALLLCIVISHFSSFPISFHLFLCIPSCIFKLHFLASCVVRWA